ncbi:MAG: DUF4397 domain-containing protein [Ginsengibacter sp.]
MKKFVIISFIVASCSKESNHSFSTSSLTIVQAAMYVPSVAISFAETPGSFYQYQAPLSYGSWMEYGIPSGATPLVVVSAEDTSHPLLDGTMDLKAGGIYSLYLTGNGAKADTIMKRDTIPYYSSVLAGVRFINLSPDSQPVSINLEGNAITQTEFNNLTYRQITPFKAYDASVQFGTYTFEIRDASTGNLLTTFSWNYTAAKSNTLVISGSVDPASSTPLQVFQVNNY